MKIFKSQAEISDWVNQHKNEGKSIGFVPTMGALHDGHASLVQRAIIENDISVTSIFVNPTQFNDKSDYENYPITFEQDIKLLEKLGCDAVFAPEVDSIYYEGEKLKNYDLDGLDSYMEGVQRPGHFKGVVNIVIKLFNIIKPDKAYFGLKDFQQYVIIKHITKKLKLPIVIIGCPIIREPGGLAMSSRNMRLSKRGKEIACLISKELFGLPEKMHHYNLLQVKEHVTNSFVANPKIELEYFEIVDSENLIPLTNWSKKGNNTACFATYVEGIRLIDNIQL